MKRKPWHSDFVEALKQLSSGNDRATLAQLRRGLGRRFGEESRRDGWVLAQLRRIGQAQQAGDTEIDRYCLIASLFATHSDPTGRGTLGAAFRQLADRPGASKDGVERRFHSLLDSDLDDLPERLRYAVSLFESKGVAIDWAQLLSDLGIWGSEWRTVQRNWSRDFWTSGNSTEEPDGSASSAPPMSERAAT